MRWSAIACMLGGVTVSYAVFSAYLLGFCFRLDTAVELADVLPLDVGLGVIFAVGLFLFGLPPVGRASPRWFTLLALTALIGGTVMTGGLVAAHEEQVRIRSS